MNPEHRRKTTLRTFGDAVASGCLPLFLLFYLSFLSAKATVAWHEKTNPMTRDRGLPQSAAQCPMFDIQCDIQCEDARERKISFRHILTLGADTTWSARNRSKAESLIHRIGVEHR